MRRTLVGVVAAALVVVTSGVAGAAGGGLSPEDAADAMVVEQMRGGHLAEASCLPLDGLSPAGRASRFACLLSVYQRPRAIAAADWLVLLDALVRGQKTRAMAVLGLRPDASDAELAAADKLVFSGHLVFRVKGMRMVNATTWEPVAAGMTPVVFRRSLKARDELRAAVPAIEAYWADHQTYAGISLASVRAFDRAIDGRLRFRVAGRDRYCIEIDAGGAVWSLAGPAVTGYVLGRCKAP